MLCIDTAKSDVKLCPGDQTHHEIIQRQGFTDTGVVNPYLRMPEAYRHFVSVPSARVARPVTCVIQTSERLSCDDAFAA